MCLASGRLLRPTLPEQIPYFPQSDPLESALHDLVAEGFARQERMIADARVDIRRDRAQLRRVLGRMADQGMHARLQPVQTLACPFHPAVEIGMASERQYMPAVDRKDVPGFF